MISGLLRDNWILFEDINGNAGHHGLLDHLMVFGAQDVVFLLPLPLLALWVAAARWSPWRGAAADHPWLAYDRALGQRIVVLTCLGVVFAVALNYIISHLIMEPRPFISHPTVDHLLIAHAADNSFPSDHTAVVSAVATALGLYFLFVASSALSLGRATDPGTSVALKVRRGFAPELLFAGTLFALALIAVAWVGLGRVYTGVHYPLDIAGGALDGLVGGLIAVALRPLAEPVLAPAIRLAERLHLA
ncbi:MAG TPA: phosphatase PAP2 family protein [Ktedonobacterales bacterium]